MGENLLGNSIIYLHVNQIYARRGYPGSMMPHITEPAVAVNIHKVTPEGMTIVAEVCSPMHKGVYACEDLARRIDEIWTEKGASVTFGGHKFDGKSGLYQMSVYGYWPYQTEEAEGTEDPTAV